jgi:hypothetical protein
MRPVADIVTGALYDFATAQPDPAAAADAVAAFLKSRGLDGDEIAPIVRGWRALVNEPRRDTTHTVEEALDALREPVDGADIGIARAFLESLAAGVEPRRGSIELKITIPALDELRNQVNAVLAQVTPIELAYTEAFGQPPADAAQICETIRDAGKLADTVRELDVALNDVPTGASLAEIVTQLNARKPVRIVNLADGMRINFRAPDGRRATLHVRATLDGAQELWIPHAAVDTMYAAMDAYPVAGSPLLVEPQPPRVCPRAGACETSPADGSGRCSTCGGWA